jgi:hypothetical protein
MLLRPRRRLKPKPRVSKPALDAALHSWRGRSVYPLSDAERANLI